MTVVEEVDHDCNHSNALHLLDLVSWVGQHQRHRRVAVDTCWAAVVVAIREAAAVDLHIDQVATWVVAVELRTVAVVQREARRKEEVAVDIVVGEVHSRQDDRNRAVGLH